MYIFISQISDFDMTVKKIFKIIRIIHVYIFYFKKSFDVAESSILLVPWMHTDGLDAQIH